ncbi:MetQ/NlpA family ABC transporter substrate-binding protein [Ectobacillus antri]|uniref:MetQ/NlpA family ABC transporter substrate-binding protein n=1 Tax=Ectobacillus antri TaxID=2486280 RepID=UPI000F5ADBB0|nr:MetQ/NlpA family ABC transporter substrate-binding protein [Ectobacillus antri]
MKRYMMIFLVFLVGMLAACGGETTTKEAGTSKTIKIGATAGPYSDMVTKAIKPQLEKKGYKVEVVEFSDYIQPNKALAEASIDANLFQHKIYMETFAKQNNMQLSEVIVVPTAPMGVYSKKFKSWKEVKDGSTIAIPNDPVNAARTLTMLQSEGIIKLNASVDPLKASEKDVTENQKSLKFQPIEAAQLPRSVESVDLAAVPGNFALAAKMNLLDAIQLEKMPDLYRNRVVVNTKDLDKAFAKDLKEAVESKEFDTIIDKEFKGFGKPEWMVNRK